jgi:hypothetical protein
VEFCLEGREGLLYLIEHILLHGEKMNIGELKAGATNVELEGTIT